MVRAGSESRSHGKAGRDIATLSRGGDGVDGYAVLEGGGVVKAVELVHDGSVDDHLLGTGRERGTVTDFPSYQIDRPLWCARASR